MTSPALLDFAAPGPALERPALALASRCAPFTATRGRRMLALEPLERRLALSAAGAPWPEPAAPDAEPLTDAPPPAECAPFAPPAPRSGDGEFCLIAVPADLAAAHVEADRRLLAAHMARSAGR